MLPAKVINVKRLGIGFVKPCVYLRPIAQQTSRKPAIIRMNHDQIVDEVIIAPLRAVFSNPGTVLARQVAVMARGHSMYFYNSAICLLTQCDPPQTIFK